MQPTNPSWRLAYSPKQPVPEYQCHHDDCRRRFVRKTSLTNHLKAHQNVRSRSIYRTKRARLRAAAARAAAEAAASADKLSETRTVETPQIIQTHTPSTLPLPHSSLPSHEKPPLPLGPETSPISSTAPTVSTPQPSTTENADTLLNDISLSLVSPISFTPQEDPLLQHNTWPVEQTLPIQIRPNNPENEQDPSFTFPPERTSEELLDPTDPNYDFLHDLYKYH